MSQRKKKLKIPKYVEVGGYRFKIVLDSTMDDHGECNSDDLIIKLNNSKNSIKETFIHELTHAALSISGQSNILQPEMEEALCDCMGNMLKDCIDIKGFKG